MLTPARIALVKSSVRAEALERRARVSADARAAFAQASVSAGPALLPQRPGAARSVASAFLPIRGEPETLPLLEALRRAGAVTALPATPARGMALRFRAWTPGDPLLSGRFGTVEPPLGAQEVEPDLLFVPLLAFDRRGFRLGYGAGFYDGVLARLRRSKPVLAVGLAFAAQEVDSIPTEPHDQVLDAVLTERGLITFGPAPCASFLSAT